VGNGDIGCTDLWRPVPGFGQSMQQLLGTLAKLNPTTVLADLNAMAEGLIPALLCFEPPPPDRSWCHRALVSAWLGDALGIKVVEFGHETAGAGWQHPKQFPSTTPQ
jgi:hypothetical protein